MAKPKAPRTVPPELAEPFEYPLFEGSDPGNDDVVSRVRFEGGDFSDGDWTAKVLETVHFDRVRLARMHAERSRWLDVRLRSCDLAGACFDGSSWSRVEFEDCRLVGLQASEARFQSVRFRDCSIECAVLHLGVFESCRFENCRLVDADFDGSDHRGSRFDGCDLSGTRFTNTKLAGADLRGSALGGVLCDPVSIRGIRVGREQAPDLLWLLGVDVRDTDESRPGPGAGP